MKENNGVFKEVSINKTNGQGHVSYLIQLGPTLCGMNLYLPSPHSICGKHKTLATNL